MGLNIRYSPGQTPLSEDEMEGLMIPSVTDRYELDEFEQLNIEKAMIWLSRKRLTPDQLLNEQFIRELHGKMFGEVWSWAAKYRLTNKNIGVDKWQILPAVTMLCDDARYWIAESVYAEDEMAIRFKHRLVSIHCFANGNGRHSRLMADVIAEKIFHLPAFSWGRLGQHVDARATYIQSLRSADKGDIQPLIRFSRS